MEITSIVSYTTTVQLNSDSEGTVLWNAEPAETMQVLDHITCVLYHMWEKNKDGGKGCVLRQSRLSKLVPIEDFSIKIFYLFL